MQHIFFKLCLRTVGTAAAMSFIYGCGDNNIVAPPKPDLVPLEVAANSYNSYNSHYCNRVSGGGLEIRVRVMNQGDAVAPPSVTCARFFGKTTCLATPQLNPGQGATLIFNLPCTSNNGNLSCGVTIEVNADSDFTESTTSNNTVEGGCFIVG